jgi:fructosamine-3-kinase
VSPGPEQIAAAVGSSVDEVHPVAGGDINQALRATLADGREIFVKYRRGARADMYEAEADGLAWLASSDAFRVPEVVAVGTADAAFLALEWLQFGASTTLAQERFGQALATLHRVGADSFGYSRDNYIGPLAQPNDPAETWTEFYGERRVRPMARSAAAAGGIEERMLPAVDVLLSRLDALIASDEPPARLHGDLWSGNGAFLPDGTPCLIDPAVYGGHREVDLAMMSLFGGFEERCFDAYHEAFPLEPGWDERVPLYQLYPVLVHAVLFGGAYGATAEAIINRYL